MITKTRQDQLIQYANQAIQDVFVQKGEVDGAYDGQIAAFSVSIAMSGLKTAMAIYMKSKGTGVDKKNIIKAIGIIYDKDNHSNGTTDEVLWNSVKDADENVIKSLQEMFLQYAIALKLTFRTFKYKENEKKSS